LTDGGDSITNAALIQARFCAAFQIIFRSALTSEIVAAIPVSK
jgi:hypothetical protein